MVGVVGAMEPGSLDASGLVYVELVRMRLRNMDVIVAGCAVTSCSSCTLTLTRVQTWLKMSVKDCVHVPAASQTNCQTARIAHDSRATPTASSPCLGADHLRQHVI